MIWSSYLRMSSNLRTLNCILELIQVWSGEVGLIVIIRLSHFNCSCNCLLEARAKAWQYKTQETILDNFYHPFSVITHASNLQPISWKCIELPLGQLQKKFNRHQKFLWLLTPNLRVSESYVCLLSWTRHVLQYQTYCEPWSPLYGSFCITFWYIFCCSLKSRFLHIKEIFQ